MTHPSKDTPTRSDTPETEAKIIIWHGEVACVGDLEFVRSLERSRNALMELCVEIRHWIGNLEGMPVPHEMWTKLCEATKSGQVVVEELAEPPEKQK